MTNTNLTQLKALEKRKSAEPSVLSAKSALSSARAESWKARRDAAAKVARERTRMRPMSSGDELRLIQDTGERVATAILALEEPRHE